VPKPSSGWSMPARRGSSTDSSCSESGVVELRRPAQASKERLRLSESGWARARRLRRRWRRWVSVRRSVSPAGPSPRVSKVSLRWPGPAGAHPTETLRAAPRFRGDPALHTGCVLGRPRTSSTPGTLRPCQSSSGAPATVKGPRTCDTGIQEPLGSGPGTFQRSEVGAVTRLRLRPRKPPRSGRRPIGS
jgi:hypothetical protein